MRTNRRRRYSRNAEIDLFTGLGPGDPGYRLRPGASGLDPMESYLEQGRVIGLLLKSLLTGGSQPFLLPSLIVLFCGLTFVSFRLLSWTDHHLRTGIPIAIVVPLLLLVVVLLAVLVRARPSERRG